MLYYLGASAVPTLIFLLLGITLLVLEMFTPGVGAAGVGGLVCLVAVIVLQLGWGNPAAAVACLANILSEFDIELPAGSIVMAGALTGMVPMEAGDVITASFTGMGSVTVKFV